MQVSELGEFGLIARLTQNLEGRSDVVLAAGDDAAVLDFGGDTLLVATVDAQVEGRHFLPGVASPEDIGHKALAVNLSDVAAMGAEPLWALVSLVLRPSLDVAFLDGIYSGLRSLATRHGVAIVGGNVAASDGPLVVDITVLGRAQRGAVLTRSGGRPGDILLITGTLGLAAAGLVLATRDANIDVSNAVRIAARQALVTPSPRLAEGTALAKAGMVTAMLDVSDGLAADVGHLCDASGVDVLIEAARIPIDPTVVAVAGATGRDPLTLALTGGEDYQLAFSVRPDALEQALAAVRGVGGTAAQIGTLTDAGSGRKLLLPDGSVVDLPAGSWDHLR